MQTVSTSTRARDDAAAHLRSAVRRLRDLEDQVAARLPVAETAPVVLDVEDEELADVEADDVPSRRSGSLVPAVLIAASAALMLVFAPRVLRWFVDQRVSSRGGPAPREPVPVDEVPPVEAAHDGVYPFGPRWPSLVGSLLPRRS